jgi:hypothetical protein
MSGQSQPRPDGPQLFPFAPPAHAARTVWHGAAARQAAEAAAAPPPQPPAPKVKLPDWGPAEPAERMASPSPGSVRKTYGPNWDPNRPPQLPPAPPPPPELPVSERNRLADIGDEIQRIENRMRTDRRGYDRDPAEQARLRALYSAAAQLE